MTSELFYEALARRRGYTNPNNHDFCEGCGETPYNGYASRNDKNVLALNGAGTCQNCAENICQVELQDWDGNQCCKPAVGEMQFDGYSLSVAANKVIYDFEKNTEDGSVINLVRMCGLHMGVINKAVKKYYDTTARIIADKERAIEASKQRRIANEKLDEIKLQYPGVAESMRIGYRGQVEVQLDELSNLLHAVGLRNFHNAKEAYEGTK